MNGQPVRSPRRFWVRDASGQTVAEGVEFTDGSVAARVTPSRGYRMWAATVAEFVDANTGCEVVWLDW